MDSTTTPSPTTAPAGGHPVTTLWTGRAGLARACWGWGVAGSAAAGLPLALATPGSLAAQACFFALCAYLVLATVGIWRAATRYTGPDVWSALAKVVAGLVLGLTLSMAVIAGFGMAGYSMVVPGKRAALQQGSAPAAPAAAQPATR